MNEITKPEPSNELAHYLDNKDYLPMFDAHILDSVPPGITLKPVICKIPSHDLWTNKDTRILSHDKVMLSAEAVDKLGMAAGVELKEIKLPQEEKYTSVPVVDKSGVFALNSKGEMIYKAQIKAAFEASILLPDGTRITREGSKVEPFTGAHAEEKVARKAKRNAVKAILGIKTQYDKEVIDKPIVMMKAIHSADSPQMKLIENKAQEAASTLYDVTPKPEEPNAADVIAKLNACETLEELEKVSQGLANPPLPVAIRDEVINFFKAKRNELEAANTVEADVF